MKGSKLKLQVKSTKPFRDQQREGESEGRLGQEFRLAGNVHISRTVGMFSSKASYERKLASLYNDKGELHDEDMGRFPINTEGRACAATILYGVTNREFEDCTVDCISFQPEAGKVVGLRMRLRVYPDGNQQAFVNKLLKNEIDLTINGETHIGRSDPDEQPELGLGGPEDEEDEGKEEEPPSAGPGEVLPGVPAAHQESAQALEKAGVISTNGKKQPPSTAHGEVMVEGQKPPQRPGRRRPGSQTTH
jgi:hypothetical protein